jgi:hypothetical protein
MSELYRDDRPWEICENGVTQGLSTIDPLPLFAVGKFIYIYKPCVHAVTHDHQTGIR